MKHNPWLIVCLLSVSACEPEPTGGIPVNPRPDLAIPPNADLAGTDLASYSYKSTKLPTCTPATVTATQLFNSVVSASCSCHKSSASPRMNTASDLYNNLVNKNARLAQMKLVTPGDITRSYVLFRLTSEGDQIPGGSAGYMPLSGMMGSSQLCQFVNWVRSGAAP
ncbi:MAG: hypothetical protein JNM40_19440 [Myxococcales bacterium]|nr:hypothetical protein [Myxococcales bacterium]